MSPRRTEPSRRIDKPEPGLFKMWLVPKGPHVAAQIIQGDDRSWRATIDGVAQEPSHLDPFHAAGVSRIWENGERIDADEYNHLRALSEWAKQHDPTHPLADPMQPVTIGRMKPPF